MMGVLKLIMCLFIVSGIGAEILLPIQPTKGGVVPLPLSMEQSQDYFTINPFSFEFIIPYTIKCQILKEAVDRYWTLITSSSSSNIMKKHSGSVETQQNPLNLGILDNVYIELDRDCNDTDFPNLSMDENYTLEISASTRTLKSRTVWGMLRALETFSQLIYKDEQTGSFILNATYINDSPRFPHRGLLLDTSRHFIPVKYILKTLDAMSYNKLNVFHWHIVDDQSFPYESTRYPGLSHLGAYHPVKAVYHPEDVKNIVEYARKRGIRVIVEFDTPAHTLSWGKLNNGLLTECFGLPYRYGPINPFSSDIYGVLVYLYQEICEVFPEKYIHLGGDELSYECWKSNPTITYYMEGLNITGDYVALEHSFTKNLFGSVVGRNFIVWEEVFNNGMQLANSTIVQVWKDGYADTMNKATKDGKSVLLSSCWHLDRLGGLKDWQNFYKCDPYDFPGTSEQKDLVLGGEACMWTEAVNENNLMSKIWPRASATAEKLWSAITDKDNPSVTKAQMDNMARRLEEHTCRLNKRNIEAEPPNGPGFC